MLCDNCIKILTLNLSKDSKLILSVLNKQQANQNIIMQLSKLSYAVVPNLTFIFLLFNNDNTLIWEGFN